MSTDKTLADVQPGGRVRLGDGPTIEKQARELLAAEHRKCDRNTEADLVLAGDVTVLGQIALNAIIAALSAQPSPGGQGDAPLRVFSAGRWTYDGTGQSFSHEDMDAAAFVVYRDAALAARQPVGEPVALVVPGAPTRCRHCESTDLEWFAHVRAVNDVPHGRLTTHDVGCVFVLGCNECSETLHTVKADSIAALLAAPPAQAVDLGQFRNAVAYAARSADFATHVEIGDKLRELLALIDSQAVGKKQKVISNK